MKTKDLKKSTDPTVNATITNAYGRAVGLIASRCISVTPSDTENIKDSDGDEVIGVLTINNVTGVAGNIRFLPADAPEGSWVTWRYELGEERSILVRRVASTGTTATGIELLVL